jgi:type II secretion system protein G
MARTASGVLCALVATRHPRSNRPGSCLNLLNFRREPNMNRTENAIRGFTLIELLIVVAIIAILAAIAVPNFLEAQARSRVSRVKSDMRSLATAIESYRVDHADYPVPADENGITIPPAIATLEGFETFLPVQLTTPISYINHLPEDVFRRTGESELRLFHYGTREYFIAVEGNDDEFDQVIEDLVDAPQPSVAWFLFSHAPDRIHNEPPEHVLYDPTNGTVSLGDIYYFGNIGFKN